MENIASKFTSVHRLTEGKTSGAAYDTAWTARVLNEFGTPVFPECIKWLLENQHSDGSWGCQVLNYHDRLLSTLATIIALKEIDGRRYSNCIQKGETYIWENLKNLELDNTRLIGSELLFPSLMKEAHSLGLDLPYHIKVYQREYQLKLKKIDQSLWYSPLTTLSFSFEFLGDTVDLDKLAEIQLPNGSVATSPAATAFFLKHTHNENAFSYLKTVLSLTGDGSAMTVYPVEVFEYGWILYNFMLARLFFERYTDVCDFLAAHLKDQGIGHSAQFPVCDADDTAVVYKVLQPGKYSLDYQVFDLYWTGEYYQTFHYELDPSMSTNIHVLDFVQSCPEFPNKEQVTENIIHFLKKNIHPQGFWIDKWHVSPYYPTAHAVLALSDVAPSLAGKAVSWILETQNENGTWGGNTVEETAYAVQALLHYHQKVDHIDTSVVSDALPHITHEVLPLAGELPELWIGKVLYSPQHVVLSSLASASIMYNTSAWKLCSGWSV
jgi:halimadienyl-diphosphate synthase